MRHSMHQAFMLVPSMSLIKNYFALRHMQQIQSHTIHATHSVAKG